MCDISSEEYEADNKFTDSICQIITAVKVFRFHIY